MDLTILGEFDMQKEPINLDIQCPLESDSPVLSLPLPCPANQSDQQHATISSQLSSVSLITFQLTMLKTN